MPLLGTSTRFAHAWAATYCRPQNSRGEPLLAAAGGTHTPAGHLLLDLQQGRASLAELRVTAAGDALAPLVPPFRLCVDAVQAEGGGPAAAPIRRAVSETFVVRRRSN